MTNDKHSDREQLKKIARDAMLERDMLAEFSRQVRAEMKRATPRDLLAHDQRKDLRDLLWASIDNDDSEDLDQLTVAVPHAGGATKIFVAVADVDEYVDREDAVDRHASHNTTSVYTSAQIFPMLPTRLSYDLTSLNENEDRAAMVVEFIVDAAGVLQDPEIYPAVVRNKAKLAYNSVGAWLAGTGPLPAVAEEIDGLAENLRLQDGAAQRLRTLREDHGALELQTIQARPTFGEDGQIAIELDQANRAKELIEDLMIATNTLTARFLRARELPSLRRVVREPRRWGRIVEFAAQYDAALPADPDAKALSQFLMEQSKRDALRFPDLSLTVIKLMGAGEYVVERPGQKAIGHFGLAVRNYTHSTAPNRRFPDLITQRMLKCACLGKGSPYSQGELDALAKYCTNKEDDADKVERKVNKAATALLLEPRVGEKFDALVTGAASKGTWVRIIDPPVEGKLIRGESGLDVGDRVQVELVGTNVARGFIDFARC